MNFYSSTLGGNIMNIEAFKSLGHLKQFTIGEFICTEKEEGDTAYLLLQGMVDIIRDAHLKSPEQIARLRPGVVFGEMSLLENKPRNASVIAATDDVIVLELTKDNFLSIINYDKEIAWNLLRTLLNRTETGIQNCPFGSLAFVTNFKNNTYYLQLQRMSCEQFYDIIAHDGEYAMKLLKFLSSTLAQLNEDAHQRRVKHCGYL